MDLVDSPTLTLPWALLAMLGVCALLGFVQNRGWLVGGAISLPKILWLHLALSAFYVIPFFLWRDVALSVALRRLFGWFLFGFLIRGVVELVVLYTSRSWRCIHGISHDVVMLGFIGIWWISQCRGPMENAAHFVPWLCVVLVFEIFNAWSFSRLADPASGIYFAADSKTFRWVNRLTWLELALLYPWLAWCLAGYLKRSANP